MAFLAPALLFCAAQEPARRPGTRAWVGAGFLLFLSWAGTADAFAWNRAKWTLGLAAQRIGIPPEAVANGLDWDAHWSYEREMAALKARKPVEAVGEWEWLGPVRGRMKGLVSARPDAFPSGRMGEISYRSPLAPRGATLYFFRHEAADPGN
jgi:hypothetical protein